MNQKVLSRVMNVLLAVLLSALVTAVLIALSAAVMLKGTLTAGSEKIILIVIRILACLAGGFFCGKKNKKRGFLWGLLIGMIYCILLLALSIFSGSGADLLSAGVITTALCCLGSGMLGGMLS